MIGIPEEEWTGPVFTAERALQLRDNVFTCMKLNLITLAKRSRIEAATQQGAASRLAMVITDLPESEIVIWNKSIWDAANRGWHSLLGTPIPEFVAIDKPQFWCSDDILMVATEETAPLVELPGQCEVTCILAIPMGFHRFIHGNSFNREGSIFLKALVEEYGINANDAAMLRGTLYIPFFMHHMSTEDGLKLDLVPYLRSARVALPGLPCDQHHMPFLAAHMFMWLESSIWYSARKR